MFFPTFSGIVCFVALGAVCLIPAPFYFIRGNALRQSFNRLVDALRSVAGARVEPTKWGRLNLRLAKEAPDDSPLVTQAKAVVRGDAKRFSSIGKRVMLLYGLCVLSWAVAGVLDYLGIYSMSI